MIPLRKLPENIRALFIEKEVVARGDYSIFKKGRSYPVRYISESELKYTGDSFREIPEVQIVSGNGSEEIKFTVNDFIKYFYVPEINSLEELYPAEYEIYRKSVEAIYRQYSLKEFDFQIQDIALLLFKKKGILAHEQGLGKSITSLVWAIAKRLYQPNIKKVLIICQGDLIKQWKDRGRDLDIDLQALTKKRKTANQTGYYITHYEFITGYYKDYADTFDMIMLDEAHKIKTGNAKRSIAVRHLQAEYKLCLTGTPFKDLIQDIHYLMGWLYGFGTEKYPYLEKEQLKFKKDFAVYEIKNDSRKMIPGVSFIPRLQYLLSHAVMRREVREPEISKNMVGAKIFLIKTPLTASQKLEYNKIKNSTINPTSRDHLLRRLTVIHHDSLKLHVTREIVNSVLNQDKQIVIASGIVDVHLHLKEMFGSLAEIANGQVKAAKREEVINNFKKGLFPILIGGMKAINTGHSLENACRILATDFPWTASTLDQITKRIHRIVSKEDVEMYLLCSGETIDERMYEIVGLKRESSELVLDGINDYEVQTVSYEDYSKESTASLFGAA